MSSLDMLEDDKDEDLEDGEILSDSQLENLIEHTNNHSIYRNLSKDFQDMMNDKQTLRSCIDSFLNHRMDELTLGVIFDMHRKYKTNVFYLEIDSSDEKNKDDYNNQLDTLDCICPTCQKPISSIGYSIYTFTTHLDKCMGFNSKAARRSRSLRSSLRVTNDKEKNHNSLYSEITTSDNEDDAHSSTGNKKKRYRKKKEVKKKGKEEGKSEKNKVEVVVEDEDEYMKLQHLLEFPDKCLENTSSSSKGVSASKTPKKRDKSKKKSRGKDSPSMVLD
ncbi:SAGA-associated factor 11 homolog [Sitophilus oryzae]|uniref:SAGA-associated factor 11 homolog n=1 Tax=Sitophilus oryzae TaxID=7048 RepID=A0A6J2YU28_SITOR|nr:SAGA-associated factor 11 homolog [Sitophilus oryzae]